MTNGERGYVSPTIRNIESAGRTAAIIAGALVAFLVLVIVFTAILRKAFGIVIDWSFEVSSLTELLIVVLGLAAAQQRRKHVSVEILVEHLPKRVRRILDGIDCGAFLGYVAVVLIFGGSLVAVEFYEMKKGTLYLDIPEFLIFVAIIAGAILLSLELTKQIITGPPEALSEWKESLEDATKEHDQSKGRL